MGITFPLFSLLAAIQLLLGLNGVPEKPQPTPTPTPIISESPTPKTEPTIVTVKPKPAPVKAPVRVNASLERIKICESGGNYTRISSNGKYFGAYQYGVPDWSGWGGYSRADLAPPSVQDARAQNDYNAGQASWRWPTCSKQR